MSGGFNERLGQAYFQIWTAFVTAMDVTGCKKAEAARGMRLTANTVSNYMSGKTPVNVARVLAFERLAKEFRNTLCGEHQAPAARRSK